MRTIHIDGLFPGVEDERVLSSDPARRRVEIDFVARLVSIGKATGEVVLNASKAAGKREDVFFTSLKAIQNPIFEQISSVLEKDVPEQEGFGKFKGSS